MKYIVKILNNKYSVLAILIIFFLALRLSIVLTDTKQIEMNEETVCGVLAHDVINHHIRLPILDYQHVEWCGDTLIVGFLAIPFFWILGDSIISLKLIPLCFSLGTLILWYLFLNKHINRTVALLTSLLLIVPPPYFTRLNLIAAIPHTELNFFSIAVVYLFFKSFHEKNPSTSLILFGLLSGLAIYCHYLFLITFACCILIWYLWDKQFIFKKNFLIFSLSFLIGLIPWIISNIHNYPFGLPIVKGSFNLILQLRKFFRLLVYNIPHSFGFDYIGNTGMKLQSWIYYLIFVSFFVSLIIQHKKLFLNFFVTTFSLKKSLIQTKESLVTLYILIFPILYILFFTLSTFYDVLPFVIVPQSTIQGVYNFTAPPFEIYRYRYLIPLYPIIFVIISIGLNYWLKSKGIKQGIAIVAIAYLLMIGFYSNYKLISWDKFGQGFIYKGYRQWEYARDIVYQEWSFKKIAASLSELEGEAKYRGYRLLGEKEANEQQYNILPVIQNIEDLSPSYRYHIYFGLFNRLTEICQGDQEKIAGLINQVPNKSKPPCYEGYGFSLGYKLLKTRTNAYTDFQSLSKMEKYFYKELAVNLEEPKWDMQDYIKSINELDEIYRPFCYIGLGKFLAREEGKENIDKCIHIMNQLDEKSTKYAYLGFGKETGELFNNVNMNLLDHNQIPKTLQKFYFMEIDLNLNKFFYYTSKVEEGFRPFLYKGLGFALRKNIEAKIVKKYIIFQIDTKYKNDCIEGLMDRGEV